MFGSIIRAEMLFKVVRLDEIRKDILGTDLREMKKNH